MTLDTIKHVAPEDFAIVEDGTLYSYVIDRGARENTKRVSEFPNLYTEEGMKQYAKECILEALKEYAPPYSDKKAASIINKVVK